MTLEELEWVVRSHRERQNRERRARLEDGRLFSVMIMQPHCGKALDPRRVLPFPWEEVAKEPTGVLDKASARTALGDFLSRRRR